MYQTITLIVYFFKSVSKSNPDINILYDKNILSFIRQIKYSKITDSSIDFVLFLNGLPIVTAELKIHLLVKHIMMQ